MLNLYLTTGRLAVQSAAGALPIHPKSRYNNMLNSYNRRCQLAEYNTSYPLRPEHWAAYRSNELLKFGKELSIYLHIPFCPQLCSFCEYTRMATPGEELQAHYVHTLSKELRTFGEQMPHLQVAGFDIGGGTPTALSSYLLEQLLQEYRQFLNQKALSADFEPSIESTFQTATAEKLHIIGAAGIARLSLGVQSATASLLRAHARRHETEEHMQTVLTTAHRAGIRKVNLDFMYGLPGQTPESIHADLELIKRLSPEQVTLYELRTNMVQLPSASAALRFSSYNLWYQGLQKLGYHAPFGRNTFSRNPADEGCSSYLRKRMFYGTPYRGFGISAQSMGLNGISYNKGKGQKGVALQHCIKAPEYSPQDVYLLPPAELAAKYLAVAGYSGQFSLKVAGRLLGCDAAAYYADSIQFCTEHGLLESLPDGILRITREGFRHIGAVFSLFYSPPPTNKI